MIFYPKYKDNQPAEPVKAKASPFGSLDRTRILIEKVFIRGNHQKRNLFLYLSGLRKGST